MKKKLLVGIPEIHYSYRLVEVDEGTSRDDIIEDALGTSELRHEYSSTWDDGEITIADHSEDD
jgi:hypothetical protein